jgi:hypothetical protein
MEVARRFVEDMRAFHAEKNGEGRWHRSATVARKLMKDNT